MLMLRFNGAWLAVCTYTHLCLQSSPAIQSPLAVWASSASSAVLQTLADYHILRYRGHRAGRRKQRRIEVIVSQVAVVLFQSEDLCRWLACSARGQLTLWRVYMPSMPSRSPNLVCWTSFTRNCLFMAYKSSSSQKCVSRHIIYLPTSELTVSNFLDVIGLCDDLGGVAVLVAEEYLATELPVEDDVCTLELLWVKINLPTRVLYVGAIYHPPK